MSVVYQYEQAPDAQDDAKHSRHKLLVVAAIAFGVILVMAIVSIVFGRKGAQPAQTTNTAAVTPKNTPAERAVGFIKAYQTSPDSSKAYIETDQYEQVSTKLKTISTKTNIDDCTASNNDTLVKTGPYTVQLFCKATTGASTADQVFVLLNIKTDNWYVTDVTLAGAV